VLARLERAEHENLGPEAREPPGEGLRALPGEHDVDVAVRPGLADLEVLAERPAQRAAEVGAAAARAVVGLRRSSTTVTIRCQASPRSKPAGRCAGWPVGSTETTRSTRNVRGPSAVPATRYHVPRFTTRPSGCTVRVLVIRSRPV